MKLERSANGRGNRQTTVALRVVAPDLVPRGGALSSRWARTLTWLVGFESWVASAYTWTYGHGFEVGTMAPM